MPPPVYRNLQELTGLCKSFIGKEITLAAVFNGKTIPIANTNLVGDLLEDVFYPSYVEACPDIKEGPPQASPDFYAADEFHLEQKSFAGTPGFDIANYASLLDQLSEKGGLVKKLFKTKYLVFQYAMVGSVIKITNFWMLNIWDLAKYDGMYPIGVQNKRGMWYNVRPGAASSWTDTSKTPRLFLEKLFDSIDSCPHLEAAKKMAVKASITEQVAEAETQGFL
jgi:hypothetical protein